MQLLKPRTSQPQFPVGIDGGNPLARGLSHLYNFTATENRTNVASRLANQTVTNITAAPSSRGVGISLNGTSSEIVGEANSISLSDKFTLFCLLNRTNAWAVSHAFQLTDSTTMISISSNSAVNGYGAVGNNGSALLGPAGNLGQFYFVVATFSGGLPTSLYVDGVSYTSSAVAGTYATSGSSSVRIGRRSGGANYWGGTFLTAGIYTRELSASEIKALSLNPWQLFEPRRIWVPVSVASGETASITAADGVATASTLTGSSTAATTVTAAAGAATASSIAGASTAVASFTQADGVATAATLQGSSGSSTITQADGTATAATMAGTSVAAAAITQADGVGSGATMVGSDAAEPTLIGRKRPRRRRQLPAEIPANKLPKILEKVSEEKDYLREVLAEAHTELTIAALSTDNAERRAQKLRKLGTDIALLEMEIAEAEDEEAFLMLVMRAAETMF